MKNEKKGLLLTALAALFSLALLNGCDDETAGAGKSVTSFKAVKVGGEENINKLVLSKDGKNAYITVKTNELHGVETAKAGEKANIDAKVSLVGFTPAAAGKSDLAGANILRHVEPTKDGALLSVGLAAGPNGVIYVKGLKPTMAWGSAQVGGLPAVAQALPDTGIFVDATQVAVGVVALDNNGKEFPIVFDTTNVTRGQSYTGVALDAAAPAALAIRNAVAGRLFPVGELASTKEFTYALNADGISVIPATSVGVAIPVAGRVIAPADATVVANANGTVGRNHFAVMGQDPAAGGQANDQLGVVFLDDKKLYIGFASTNANNGGVAVYEIQAAGTAPKIYRPAAGGVGVKGFVKQGKNVLAVTDKALLITKIDTNKVEIKEDYLKSLKDSDTATYNKANFPTENIVAAGADKNGNLFIATSDKGLIVGSTKKGNAEEASSSSSTSDSSSK